MTGKTETLYQPLEPRPGSNYLTLFLKGRRIRAAVVEQAIHGPDPFTPDEFAEEYQVPLKAVLEALEYVRAIPGSTAKPRQFDPVQSSGRGGPTAHRDRPETDLRGRQVFRRPGRRGAVAESRPPCGARGRGLALPPAHRGVTTRVRRAVRSFACRQRPQPHPPDRNAAERIP
jgi:hypothetical protein